MLDQDVRNPLSQSTIDALLKEARKADRVDRERAEAFERMLKSDGWKLYVQLVNARVQLFSDTLLAPSGSVDGAVRLEYIKGAMSGMLLALGIPSATIDAMKPLIDDKNAEESGQ